jgi:small conductance mechanosensitive channel
MDYLKCLLFLSDTTEVVEKPFSLEELIGTVVTWLATEGVKLLIGLFVLFIVFKIINVVAKKFKKRMEKKNRDKTITKVGYNVIRKGLKLLVFLIFLGYIGIDTAGIGTAIASAGVAIGLALQGSLGNLAGGLLILILRPFKIGDYIEAQGEGGTVEDISIFYTYLTTPDNKVVMIPNGALANGNILNYSMKDLRRVDFEFSIAYDEDYERAKKAINEVIETVPNILLDPQPLVRMKTHGESTINIVTRVWVKSENYWDVYYDMMEAIKTKFDNENIEIPFNQLDVHIKNK